ncbi:MAG: hypothetical protein LBH49_00645, partial [Puniceicoccales bacterium]|nr:hypothetical protein [Puniceicoccales bacterium]
MIKINPADYAPGTGGAMAPNFEDPNDPRNNVFNKGKHVAFYEYEANIPEGGFGPRPSPSEVKKSPGEVPMAWQLGIREPEEYKAPISSSAVANTLFPTFEEPIAPAAPTPRESAIDNDLDSMLKSLPEYALRNIDKLPDSSLAPDMARFEFITKAPLAPSSIDHAWSVAEEYGFDQKSIESLTFVEQQKYLENAAYSIDRNESISLENSAAFLLKAKSQWNNMRHSFLGSFSVLPSLPNNCTWAQLISYVNYYLIRDSFDYNASISTEATEILGEQIAKTVLAEFPEAIVKNKLALIQNEILRNEVDLALNSKEAGSKSLLEEIVAKVVEVAMIAVKTESSNAFSSISNKITEIINDLPSEIVSNEVKSQLRTMLGGNGEFISSAPLDIRSIIIDEVNKKRFDITMKDLSAVVTKSHDEGIQISEATMISADNIDAFKNCMEYFLQKLKVQKSQVPLPTGLSEIDIVDGRPGDLDDIIQVLNEEMFSLDKFVHAEVNSGIFSVIKSQVSQRLSLEKILKELNLRKLNQGLDVNLAEDVRYSISDEFSNTLISAISEKVVTVVSDLLISSSDVSNQNVSNAIKEALAEVVENLDTLVDTEHVIDVQALKNEVQGVLSALLVPDNEISASSMAYEVIGKTAQNAVTNANKKKIEAQLNYIKSLLVKTDKNKEIDPSLELDEATKLKWEYAYGKLLKDHYEPMLRNELLATAAGIDDWLALAGNRPVACVTIQNKITELRKQYGVFYEAMQAFENKGKCFLEGSEYIRFKDLMNQYDLFSEFFTNDKLNMEEMILKYITTYNRFGIKCYASREKFDISDYNRELEKILSGFTGSYDEITELVKKRLQNEKTNLIIELYLIDIYVSYVKANYFNQDFFLLLTNDLVENWRTDDVQRQLLLNKVYEIAIDYGILKTNDNGNFVSATTLNSPDYRYVNGIADTIKGYNFDTDPQIIISQILKTIKNYTGTDLYTNDKFLAELHALLTKGNRIKFDPEDPLLKDIVKYADSTTIDFTLRKLLVDTIPGVKGANITPGLLELEKTVNAGLGSDMNAQFKLCTDGLVTLNEQFAKLSKTVAPDDIQTVIDAISTLTTAQKPPTETGSRAAIISEFVEAYNVILGQIKVNVLPKLTDYNNYLASHGPTDEGVLEKVSAVIFAVDGVIGTVNSKNFPDIEAKDAQKLAATMADVQNILKYNTLGILLTNLQNVYPSWATNDEVKGKVTDKIKAHNAMAWLNTTKLIQTINDFDPNNISIAKIFGDMLEIDPAKYYKNDNDSSGSIAARFPSIEIIKTIFSSLDGGMIDTYYIYMNRFKNLDSIIGDICKASSLLAMSEGIKSLNALGPLPMTKGNGDASRLMNMLSEVYNMMLNELKTYTNANGVMTNYLSAINVYLSNKSEINRNSLRAAFVKLKEKLFDANGIKKVLNDYKNYSIDEEVEALTDKLNYALDNHKAEIIGSFIDILYPNWASNSVQYEGAKTELSSYSSSMISEEICDTMMAKIEENLWLKDGDEYSFEEIMNDVVTSLTYQTPEGVINQAMADVATGIASKFFLSSYSYDALYSYINSITLASLSNLPNEISRAVSNFEFIDDITELSDNFKPEHLSADLKKDVHVMERVIKVFNTAMETVRDDLKWRLEDYKYRLEAYIPEKEKADKLGYANNAYFELKDAVAEQDSDKANLELLENVNTACDSFVEEATAYNTLKTDVDDCNSKYDNLIDAVGSYNPIGACSDSYAALNTAVNSYKAVDSCASSYGDLVAAVDNCQAFVIAKLEAICREIYYFQDYYGGLFAFKNYGSSNWGKWQYYDNYDKSGDDFSRFEMYVGGYAEGENKLACRKKGRGILMANGSFGTKYKALIDAYVNAKKDAIIAYDPNYNTDNIEWDYSFWDKDGKWNDGISNNDNKVLKDAREKVIDDLLNYLTNDKSRVMKAYAELEETIAIFETEDFQNGGRYYDFKVISKYNDLKIKITGFNERVGDNWENFKYEENGKEKKGFEALVGINESCRTLITDWETIGEIGDIKNKIADDFNTPNEINTKYTAFKTIATDNDLKSLDTNFSDALDAVGDITITAENIGLLVGVIDAYGGMEDDVLDTINDAYGAFKSDVNIALDGSALKAAMDEVETITAENIGSLVDVIDAYGGMEDDVLDTINDAYGAFESAVDSLESAVNSLEDGSALKEAMDAVRPITAENINSLLPKLEDINGIYNGLVGDSFDKLETVYDNFKKSLDAYKTVRGANLIKSLDRLMATADIQEAVSLSNICESYNNLLTTWEAIGGEGNSFSSDTKQAYNELFTAKTEYEDYIKAQKEYENYIKAQTAYESSSKELTDYEIYLGAKAKYGNFLSAQTGYGNSIEDQTEYENYIKAQTDYESSSKELADYEIYLGALTEYENFLNSWIDYENINEFTEKKREQLREELETTYNAFAEAINIFKNRPNINIFASIDELFNTYIEGEAIGEGFVEEYGKIKEALEAYEAIEVKVSKQDINFAWTQFYAAFSSYNDVREKDGIGGVTGYDNFVSSLDEYLPGYEDNALVVPEDLADIMAKYEALQPNLNSFEDEKLKPFLNEIRNAYDSLSGVLSSLSTGINGLKMQPGETSLGVTLTEADIAKGNDLITRFGEVFAQMNKSQAMMVLQEENRNWVTDTMKKLKILYEIDNSSIFTKEEKIAMMSINEIFPNQMIDLATAHEEAIRIIKYDYNYIKHSYDNIMAIRSAIGSLMASVDSSNDDFNEAVEAFDSLGLTMAGTYGSGSAPISAWPRRGASNLLVRPVNKIIANLGTIKAVILGYRAKLLAYKTAQKNGVGMEEALADLEAE